MTRIKICGLSRECDIEFANRYRPDYIGFVFAKSKRRVSAKRARELAGLLDNGIKTVGVFVNADMDEVAAIAETVGLYAVQLHGDEDEEYIRELRKKVSCAIWKAVRVRNAADILACRKYNADMLLLDKYTADNYGGSGEVFDWSGISAEELPRNLILAGGLNKDNVLGGIEIFKPYAVDVSSGVETDGVKDENKIKDFIFIIRNGESHE